VDEPGITNNSISQIGSIDKVQSVVTCRLFIPVSWLNSQLISNKKRTLLFCSIFIAGWIEREINAIIASLSLPAELFFYAYSQW